MVPTNNLLHSLINEMEICIGKNRHIIREDSYFYKSYMKSLFDVSFNSPRREFELMDLDISTLTRVNNQFNINNEYVGSKRVEKVKSSNKFEMMGPICVSCLEGYMFSKVPLKITVNLADPRFTVWTDGSREYQFHIDEIYMKAKIVSLPKELTEGIEKRLMKEPGVYNFEKHNMVYYNIEKSVSNFSVKRLFDNYIPNEVILAFTPESNFLGSFIRKTHFYGHVNIAEITINGLEGEITKVNTDFVTGHGTMSLYKAYVDKCKGVPIINEMDYFFQGNTLFCIKIPKVKISPPISINIRFRVPVNENFILLAFSKQNAQLVIDKDRNCNTIMG